MGASDVQTRRSAGTARLALWVCVLELHLPFGSQSQPHAVLVRQSFYKRRHTRFYSERVGRGCHSPLQGPPWHISGYRRQKAIRQRRHDEVAPRARLDRSCEATAAKYRARQSQDSRHARDQTPDALRSARLSREVWRAGLHNLFARRAE